MYCQKCGKEIPDGEQFCSSCGTKAGETPQSSIINTEELKARTSKAYDTLKTNVQTIRSSQENQKLIRYNIGIIIALVLGIFLVGSDFITVSAYSIASDSESILYILGEAVDSGIVSILTYVLYVLAIAVMVLPLIKSKIWKVKSYVPTIIAAIWSILLALIVIVAAFASKNSNMFGSAVKISLTFGGWIFILSLVAEIVLSVLAIKEIKKNKGKM